MTKFAVGQQVRVARPPTNDMLADLTGIEGAVTKVDDVGDGHVNYVLSTGHYLYEEELEAVVAG